VNLIKTFFIFGQNFYVWWFFFISFRLRFNFTRSICIREIRIKKWLVICYVYTKIAFLISSPHIDYLLWKWKVAVNKVKIKINKLIIILPFIHGIKLTWVFISCVFVYYTISFKFDSDFGNISIDIFCSTCY
jgi:hypothetical protein